MFQMGGVGPMFGQYNHFGVYAPEKIPYAIERYLNESNRLLRVLDKRLSEAAYLAGAEYSIADIATYPWVHSMVRREILSLDATPGVARWYEALRERPGVQRGMALMQEDQKPLTMSDEARDLLFGKGQHQKR
jgi:GST-like protein